VTEPLQQGIQSVVQAAARKGVALDIRRAPSSVRTPEAIAAVFDVELGQVVQASIFVAPRPEGRLSPIVCLASGRDDVDLGLLAAVTGEVALRPATAREAREITGSLAGGIPPFGFGHGLRTVMDRDLSRYQWIWAPAGSDSEVMRVSPGTLRMLCNAVVVPLVGSNWLAAPTPALAPSLALGVNP
jgi:prolyl-tRNA editing enzyme YbaK/EbsC (Cys-tRNA(Pro) deacylase)